MLTGIFPASLSLTCCRTHTAVQYTTVSFTLTCMVHISATVERCTTSILKFETVLCLSLADFVNFKFNQ